MNLLSLEWLIHGGFGGSGRKGYLWSAFNAIIFYQKMNFFRHNLVINKKVFWNISLITNSKLSDESTVHEGLVLEAKFRCSMVSLPLGYQLKIIFFLIFFLMSWMPFQCWWFEIIVLNFRPLCSVAIFLSKRIKIYLFF